MQTLVIRADAGDSLGTGHIMRMLALAQAFRRRGGDTLFLTASCPPQLVKRIKREGFEHRQISCEEPGDSLDSKATRDFAQDWLVLDGYHFQEEYQLACKERDLKLLCVDDFGHCEDWHCDALLNQNLGVEPSGRHPELQLMGATHALLRQEFLEHPRTTKPWSAIKKVLVTLGGSDPINATQWVLQQLAHLPPRDLEVRVLIGPDNKHQERLRALALPFQVEWRDAATDMPAEYLWADGVISAGGSSCWEWLYFGLPGAVVTISDNQKPVAAAISSQKLASCLGWPGDSDVSDQFALWLDHPADLIDHERVSRAIDGRGADRVIANLDGTQCILRQVDPDSDARFTFHLTNDPAVRSAGFATAEITWDEHCAWLSRHHHATESHLFIIESPQSTKLGTLRFHQSENSCEIGIALTKEARGQGYAHHAIQLGISELTVLHGIKKFAATIRTTNDPSKQLFTSLGFTHLSSRENRETWTFRSRN